jgi:hypothetical protein
MKNFEITYKSSVFDSILGTILFLLFSSVFVLIVIDNQSQLSFPYLLLLILAVSSLSLFIWFFMRSLSLIISNIKGHKKFSFINGKFSFPVSTTKNQLIEVTPNQISNGAVINAPRSGVKFLRFYVNGKKFTFNDSDFSEKEFSIICNSVVKRSLRCKCCQSKQVEWSGEAGHCYNCETITPKNADSFDWSNAYQA